MNKPFFALSSLASLAGLVVVLVGTGCSDDSAESTVDATEPAGGDKTAAPPETPAPPKAPGGGDSNDNGGGGGDTPATTCMDTKPYDATTVRYHPPAVKARSCTAADIKMVSDELGSSAQVSIDDVKAKLAKQSKTCGDCAFGTSDEEKWAAIVLDGTTAFLNGGGCVSVVSEKDACGQAYQQWNTCLNDVCAACTDQDAKTKCLTDAQQGPCATASKALGDGCGRDVNDYLSKCFGGDAVSTVVEQLCGAPKKDS